VNICRGINYHPWLCNEITVQDKGDRYYLRSDIAIYKKIYVNENDFYILKDRG
jgi:hypothetical protein